MRDDEKVTDPDEPWAAKIWAVYIDEAEKYDKALVESWRSDMEGLLIFAALFSAIVTAFIIESYKTFNSDSSALTVQLLSQISQQLAAAANGSTFNVPQTIPFTPPTTSVVCNAFWFISLGLSLACALVATLVEQWAREFLHRTDMRSAPLIRARMFSYLYYGLRRFHMHTVVEIIPILLHASLLFFLGGLVAFLIPVNLTMTWVAAALLSIIAAVYVVLTFLLLRYLDCPYRTPLSVTTWQVLKTFKRTWPLVSETVWRVFNALKQIWPASYSDPDLDARPAEWGVKHQVHSSWSDDTIVQAIFCAALDPQGRSERDYRALVWTMKSLADEAELEPFVEAIPDLLSTPNGECRRGYSRHILDLVHNPDIRLDNRIAALLDSCHTGVLSADDSKRRLIICYKAFWAIAILSSDPAQSFTGSNAAVDFSHIYRRPTFESSVSNPDIAPYLTSAKAVMCRSTFCALGGSFVAQKTPAVTNHDLSQVKSSLEDMYAGFFPSRDVLALPQSKLQRCREMSERLSRVPPKILFNYLGDSAHLNFPPYQWERTQSVISQWATSEHLYSPGYALEECLEIIINAWQQGSVTAPDTSKKPWINTGIVLTLLRFWCTEKPTRIPSSIVQLLNHSPGFDFHTPDIQFGIMIVAHLWSSFLATLTFRNPFPNPLATRATLTALWNLASLHRTGLETCVCVLEALDPDSSFTEISTSITALIRRNLLNEISRHDGRPTEKLLNAAHHIFPRQNTIQIPGESDDILALEIVQTWVEEATLTALVEFLELCSSDPLPYRAAETLRKIAISSVRATIPASIQIRLANSIQNIYTRGLQELMNEILKYKLWDIYPKAWVRVLWLDDPVARDKIKAVFTDYLTELQSTGSLPAILYRLQDVLRSLDFVQAQYQEPGSANILGSTPGVAEASSAPRANDRAEGSNTRRIEAEDISPGENV
ncbi:hypothetical protein C8R44DRAFT_716761 [Mycena epipterygia]|nr:hypothetical protein C8R44DRAFT_716761 [Mycena epipterygia]